MKGKKYVLIAMIGILSIALMAAGSLAANRDFDKAETIRFGSLGPVQLVPGIGGQGFDTAPASDESGSV